MNMIPIMASELTEELFEPFRRKAEQGYGMPKCCLCARNIALRNWKGEVMRHNYIIPVLKAQFICPWCADQVFQLGLNDREVEEHSKAWIERNKEPLQKAKLKATIVGRSIELNPDITLPL